eukprot:GEZU01013612.1.p1 GENE.GEZU01013612.1~~GEZU01013612.1.p1  ORF type:complete len:255 (-),score=31.22 GEZU01013612.1:44-808(-)
MFTRRLPATAGSLRNTSTITRGFAERSSSIAISSYCNHAKTFQQFTNCDAKRCDDQSTAIRMPFNPLSVSLRSMLTPVTFQHANFHCWSSLLARRRGSGNKPSKKKNKQQNQHSGGHHEVQGEKEDVSGRFHRRIADLRREAQSKDFMISISSGGVDEAIRVSGRSKRIEIESDDDIIFDEEEEEDYEINTYRLRRGDVSGIERLREAQQRLLKNESRGRRGRYDDDDDEYEEEEEEAKGHHRSGARGGSAKFI